MAKMIDIEPTAFAGERIAYNAFKDNLADDIICYFNREVEGLEFDFCLLIKNLGLVIIEVKGWHSKDVIKVVSPDEIHLSLYPEPQKSPKKQAKSYRFALRNLFLKQYGLSLPVVDLVCYPFMTESEYLHNGLKIVSEPKLTLFSEDLSDKTKLNSKLLYAFKSSFIQNADPVKGHVYDTIRSHFESKVQPDLSPTVPYSRLRVFPDGLAVGDAEKLLSEYAQGIKQVLFVSSQGELDMLAANLNSFLNSKGLLFSGSISVVDEPTNQIQPKNGVLNCFIFEAYAVPNLHGLCSQKLMIENGVASEAEDHLLQTLAQVSTFNYQQFKIEHADPNKNIQITAGAGTGKTYSMISRISFLVNSSSNSGIHNPAAEIAMLTFTVDAATNMKTRIKAQFMNYFCLTRQKQYLELVSSVERMRISTIHSFSKEVIQNTSLPLGIGSDFSTISGSYDKKRILNRVLNEYLAEARKRDPNVFYSAPINLYKLEDTILDFIDRLYSKGCDVKTAAIESFGQPLDGFSYINDLIEKVIKRTEIEYSKYLLENNSVALLEYMIYLNACIAHPSFNPDAYPFKIVFVDEFQDVDDSQIAAFHLMQDKLEFKFFIVGDLKQSIYRFRGATLGAFTQMVIDKSDWLFFFLTNNYRSDRRLLDSYDPVFSIMGKNDYLPYGADDVLTGVKQNSEQDYSPIQSIELTPDSNGSFNDDRYDRLFEAATKRCEWINEQCKTHRLSLPEKTVAILVRTNSQIAQVLSEAKKRDLVVLSDNNTSLYKLQPALDLCKLTAALCNPYNPVYLFDLIQSNNIRCAFPIDALNGLDEEKRTSLLISCLDQCYQQLMHITWEGLVGRIKQEPVLKVLHEIYMCSKPWLHYSPHQKKQIYYRTNYELLFEELSRANKKTYLTLDAVNESLNIAITTAQEAPSREIVDEDMAARIICTTVHRSKGLEYDTVLLPFVNDPIDHLKRNAIEVTYLSGKVGYYLELEKDVILTNNYFVTDDELREIKREECRILYVALTRAINHFAWFWEKQDEPRLSWASFLEVLK